MRCALTINGNLEIKNTFKTEITNKALANKNKYNKQTTKTTDYN